MAGRRIKLMLVVVVDEDAEPALFEACRKGTAKQLDNSAWKTTVLDISPMIVGIEHVYDR